MFRFLANILTSELLGAGLNTADFENISVRTWLFGVSINSDKRTQ